jgi:translation initiation factor 4E
MLAAIGETFDPALTDPTFDTSGDPHSLVTGVIVSSRQQFFRISIWTRLVPSVTAEIDPLRQRIESIGRHFKENVLGYNRSQKLAAPLATEVEFQSHKDSERKGKGKKIIV